MDDGGERFSRVTPEEVVRSLNSLAKQWVSTFGDDGFIPGRSGTSDLVFLQYAERAWFAALKGAYPQHFAPLESPDAALVRLTEGPIPLKGVGVVYLHIGASDEYLYVGQTRNYAKRQLQHRLLAQWWHEVKVIAILEPEADESLLGLEKRAIQRLHPKYNITHNRGAG